MFPISDFNGAEDFVWKLSDTSTKGLELPVLDWCRMQPGIDRRGAIPNLNELSRLRYQPEDFGYSGRPPPGWREDYLGGRTGAIPLPSDLVGKYCQ